MTKPAIKVEGLCKEYVVGAAHQSHSTFYDLLSQTMKAPFQRFRNLAGGSDESNQFWALRDINFEVQPGEVLGVIGRNGAGKSTLLKILSRITAPTRGRVTVQGRMASLLEVGTGFHPELSGRENIYLNATILGMTQKEVDRKFDAIVDFSGVEKFLDTPVKRYSSGMYVRLAFAVAAHVEADILLVDEVLAVGDAEFQRRCLGKMKEVANTGRAVVFVSHNFFVMRNLCSTGLLLRNGAVAETGSISNVLESYSGGQSMGSNETFLDATDRQENEAYVRRVSVKSDVESANGFLSAVTSVHVEVDVEVASVMKDSIDVFLHCYDENQQMVFSSGSFFGKEYSKDPLTPGTHRFSCCIPGHLLNDGQYALDILLVRNRQDVIATETSVLTFRIADDFPVTTGWHWRPAGVVRPNLRWECRPVF